ncbi:SDR family NAD(P)-dependent oxidoreductase [Bacteroidota bacterium]
MNKKKYFRDKVIVVTGASSGIGRELAFQLAGFNATVVLAARNEKKLLELNKQIIDKGEKALPVVTDVSKEDEVKKLINTTIEKFGRIDIFVSNAGQYFQGKIEETGLEDFRKSMEVNFYSSIFAVKSILDSMVSRRSGFIVFVNSLDAYKGLVGDAPYVAAKSALDGFGDVLRQEVKPFGVKVISVYPGRVDTPMIEDLKVPIISRKISTKSVADAIINGIVKKKPVVVIPKLFYNLGALNRTFPRLMDWFYNIFKLEGEQK